MQYNDQPIIDEINVLNSIIHDTRLLYKALGRTTHLKKLKAIENDIKEITEDTLKEPLRKLIDIIKILEKEFLAAEKSYKRKHPFRTSNFIKELNNSNNPDYRFPHLLGLVLKNHYEWAEEKGFGYTRTTRIKDKVDKLQGLQAYEDLINNNTITEHESPGVNNSDDIDIDLQNLSVYPMASSSPVETPADALQNFTIDQTKKNAKNPGNFDRIEEPAHVVYEKLDKFAWSKEAFQSIIVHWVAETKKVPIDKIDKNNPLELSKEDLDTFNRFLANVPHMFAKYNTGSSSHGVSYDETTHPSIAAVISALDQFERRLKKMPFASKSSIRLELIISKLLPSILTAKKLTTDTELGTEDYLTDCNPILNLLKNIGKNLNISFKKMRILSIIVDSKNFIDLDRPTQIEMYKLIKTIEVLEEKHYIDLGFELDLPITRKEGSARTQALLDKYVTDKKTLESIQSNWVAEFHPQILKDLFSITISLVQDGNWNFQHPAYIKVHAFIKKTSESLKDLYRLNFKEVAERLSDEQLSQLPEKERKVQEKRRAQEDNVLDDDQLVKFEEKFLVDFIQLINEICHDQTDPLNLLSEDSDPLLWELWILATNHHLVIQRAEFAPSRILKDLLNIVYALQHSGEWKHNHPSYKKFKEFVLEVSDSVSSLYLDKDLSQLTTDEKEILQIQQARKEKEILASIHQWMRDILEDEKKQSPSSISFFSKSDPLLKKLNALTKGKFYTLANTQQLTLSTPSFSRTLS